MLGRATKTSLLGTLCGSLSSFAWAQASSPAAGPSSSSAGPSVTAQVYAPITSGGSMIWFTFITLVLLAAVVVVIAWLIHKNMSAAVPNSAIKILSVQSLGPRERIVIASVAGRIYVLGHTPSTITLLSELSATEVAGLVASPAPIDFATRLSELLRKARR